MIDDVCVEPCVRELVRVFSGIRNLIWPNFVLCKRPKFRPSPFLYGEKIDFIIKKKCVSGKTLKTGKSFLLGTIVEPILQKMKCACFMSGPI